MNVKLKRSMRIVLLPMAVIATIVLLGQPSLAFGGSPVSVQVDGRSLTLDQPAVIQQGRVLVPLRGIFENMGATVTYDAATRTVRAVRGTSVIGLTLDSTSATLNGRPVVLEAPAQEIGGRTMVPLRFISEALGATVNWTAASRMVMISSAASVPPSTMIGPPPVTVAPRPMAPVIDSVSHTGPSGNLKAGDSVTVQVIGTPDCTATFDVGGLTSGIGMREVSPGHYEGTYTLGSDLRASLPVTLVAHLEKGGLQTALQDPNPLAVMGQTTTQQTPVVRLNSPRKSDRVSNDFVVTGTTVPNATVECTAFLPHDVRVKATGQADSSGNFSVPIRLGHVGKHSGVSLRVRAIDSNGGVSKEVREHIIATGE